MKLDRCRISSLAVPRIMKQRVKTWKDDLGFFLLCVRMKIDCLLHFVGYIYIICIAVLN